MTTTSKRAQVLLEDIAAEPLHKGLAARWVAAWGDERGACRGCSCTDVGTAIGICSD